MITFFISSVLDLKKPAKKVIELLSEYPVICFEGEMGVGKTTFIKEICSQMGVTDDTSSPTFSIVNEYLDKNDESIYHFDFFRIKNLKEAIDIGVDEYFYSDDPCLIEWPEKINELIPDDHLKISIKLVEDNNRELSIHVPS